MQHRNLPFEIFILFANANNFPQNVNFPHFNIKFLHCNLFPFTLQFELPLHQTLNESELHHGAWRALHHGAWRALHHGAPHHTAPHLPVQRERGGPGVLSPPLPSTHQTYLANHTNQVRTHNLLSAPYDTKCSYHV